MVSSGSITYLWLSGARVQAEEGMWAEGAVGQCPSMWSIISEGCVVPAQVLRTFDSLVSTNCTQELENTGVDVWKHSRVWMLAGDMQASRAAPQARVSAHRTCQHLLTTASGCSHRSRLSPSPPVACWR